MSAIIVYHSHFGCDTGCCGHRIERGENSTFVFSHPNGDDFREFAEQLLHDTYGSEHIADLDWENCLVVDD